jgi:hypothetical protein
MLGGLLLIGSAVAAVAGFLGAEGAVAVLASLERVGTAWCGR